MNDQIFADGIGAISVIGTTVRLDFVTLSPTERDEKGQPKTVFCQRVVMGMDGFLRSAQKYQEALQALQKMGALQAAPNSGAAKPGENAAPRAGETAERRLVEEALGIAAIPPRA